MCAHRLWPTVQALGRGLITNRNEILQQGVRAYNAQNINSGYLGNQGYQQQNSLPGHDHLTWTKCITHNPRGGFNKVVSRSLQYGNADFVKTLLHHDGENEFAHAILRSLPAYSTTTVGKDALSDAYYQHTMHLSNTDWEKCTAKEVADGFMALSQLCHHQQMDLEDTQHSSLCVELSKRLVDLSDQQLLMVLSSLALWPPTRGTQTPNFLGLWNGLDKVCTSRMKQWDISQMFLVADHWFALKLSKLSRYNLKMTKTLGRQVRSMEPSQFVQFLFYANLSRELQPFVVLKELELKLMEILKHVSIEELGVIAMGFFKTQTFLKSEKLIDLIISKTQDNLEFVSEVSLCAILKYLRSSVPGTRAESLQGLLEALKPHLPRLNHMVLLHVALLGNHLLLFNEGVIEIVANIFYKDMHLIRLKDVERISFVLMLYNFLPKRSPNMLARIAEEIRKPERLTEINMYPKCFVSCVVYLMNMGFFAPDLISAALQPSMLDYLSRNQNYSDMDREVNELDFTLEIEGPPGYSGYRLPPDAKKEIAKKYISRIPTKAARNLTHQEKLILEVQEKIGAMLGGPQFVAITNVLPHIQIPDLVFCTSMNGEPVELPSAYLDQDPASVKHLYHRHELQWNAVIVGGRNSFLRHTTHLQGKVQTKKRQLSTLGYHVCVVPHMEYNRKGLKVKLRVLERVLSEGSTLATEGCCDIAFTFFKGQHILQEETYG